MTVAGIDTHKDTLAACAVDGLGRSLEHRSFANTPAGHAELAGWVAACDADLVAVEGSGNYGRPAVRVLVGAGAEVREVPPNMTAAGRRRQRTRTKTDPADAVAIARVGLREAALPPPRPDGAVEDLRSLVRYRCELVAQRTRLINRLHADLSQLRPGYHHRTGRLTSASGLLGAAVGRLASLYPASIHGADRGLECRIPWRRRHSISLDGGRDSGRTWDPPRSPLG
ncbi:IS110 family transposase [Candidatus Poriferisodalis sp.]|uniref:IS110 family transposase n=1 Tax=Candidatus Poriferisodalis sp. TaxID=3101277 RepID=UPI003B02308E